MLTPEQKAAVSEILEMYDDNARAATLSGGPGTGKTFTVGEIVRAFVRRGKTVAVAASTNRALGIVNRKATEQGWWRYVQWWGTAHKLMGWVVGDDGETRRLGRTKAADFDIVVVEEASMLGSEMVHAILDAAVWVLFVGDRDQAPPIGEDTSPLFLINGPKLLRNMRQKDERITTLVEYTRKAIAEQLDGIPMSLIAPFAIKDLREWEAGIKRDPSHAAFVYTNEEVTRLNIMIRAGQPDEYVLGDRIIFRDSLRRKVLGRSEVLFAASETAVVKEATRSKVDDWPVWSLRVRSEENEANERYIYVQDTSDPPYLSWLLEQGVKKPPLANIHYAHAITTHRGQGGEYDVVHVNLPDFRRCQSMKERRSLLYVAFSRARKELRIYTG